MKINGFELVNEEKVKRALHGNLGRGGQLVGGVGDEATPEALLAEYDRLGGLVRKGALNVKTGSFYNFAEKKPREKPVVSFLTNLDDQIVEVDEAEALALESIKEKKESLKKKTKDAQKKKLKQEDKEDLENEE